MPPRGKAKRSSKGHAEPEEEGFDIVLEPLATNNKKRKYNDDTTSYVDNSVWDSKLDVRFSVRARGRGAQAWETVKKYNKFQVTRHWDPENPLTLEVGDLVYVLPDSNEDDATVHGDRRFWIAKVLECRAKTTKEVFLRVIWVYRPEDLPMGRQPYHGASEVIPSNHMQIVDALTVDGRVDGIEFFDEQDDATKETRINEHYWRQTYNCRTGELSELREYCKCKQYANPDVALIQCSNTNCKKWMHQGCIEQDTVLRIYEKSMTQPAMGGAALKDAIIEEEAPITTRDAIVETLTSLKKAMLGPRKARPVTPSPAEAEKEDIDESPARGLAKSKAGDSGNDGASSTPSIIKNGDSSPVPDIASTKGSRGGPKTTKQVGPSTPTLKEEGKNVNDDAIPVTTEKSKPSGRLSKPAKSASKASAKSTPAKAKDSDEPKVKLQEASKHFSAKVIHGKSVKGEDRATFGNDDDEATPSVEDMIVEDEDVEVEIRDLRDGKNGESWCESVKCFFCAQSVS